MFHHAGFVGNLLDSRDSVILNVNSCKCLQAGGGWELGGSHIQQPFSGEGGELSDVEGEDEESIFSLMEMRSPSHHTDAQTLALMLQEQLDAINNEIRYVLMTAA